MVQSCCLTWHSSCEASLFTIWNLSQVVILKLERCGFLFLWKLILSSIILCSLFWIRKFCASSVVPNFCETLNGFPVKFHLSPFEMLQRSQFWNKNVAVFCNFEVYIVSNNSLFYFVSNGKFCASSENFFHFFLNFEKYIFNIFLETDYMFEI